MSRSSSKTFSPLSSYISVALIIMVAGSLPRSSSTRFHSHWRDRSGFSRTETIRASASSWVIVPLVSGPRIRSAQNENIGVFHPILLLFESESKYYDAAKSGDRPRFRTVFLRTGRFRPFQPGPVGAKQPSGGKTAWDFPPCWKFPLGTGKRKYFRQKTYQESR